MQGIVICLGRARNARFRNRTRTADKAKLAKRYLIIINLNEGRTVSETARVLVVAESTVRRVRRRFLDEGEAGLIVRREENPPDCPDHNRIERTWQDLHANVTRNHTCADLKDLMRNVRGYLKKSNRGLQQPYANAA